MSTIDKITTLYHNLNLDEKREVHSLFREEESFTEKFTQLQKLIFRKVPPTPEEFLDPANKWLPAQVINSIYDHVREDFLEIANPTKIYTQVVQYGGTRLGKSFLARLLIMYTIVYIHHLRDSQLFYRLSPVTSLAIYIMAFKFDKTKQLLLKPLYNLFDQSERFIRVKFQDFVPTHQKEIGLDYIVYSKAATVGEITLESGLQILMGNDDPLSIIGADVIQMYVSEIAFFIENAGATEEQIFRLYSDGLDRIKATVGKNYLAFCYLDTSANDAESMIENYIIKVLSMMAEVYFKWRSRWEARPYLCPDWEKTGETFAVITGSGMVPAAIVTTKEQLVNVSSDIVVNVPIDYKPEFERSLLKSIKDIAGRPTSNENKFIQNIAIIDEMFIQTTPNVEGIIVCDSSVMPEKYLWNELRDKFFFQYNGVDWILRRAPKEPRWIGLDLAHSAKGDIVGITLLHKEFSSELKESLYVVDFSFPVGPGENGINLEAVQFFVRDLITQGKVHIHAGAVDQFQSVNLIQFLKRVGVDMQRQSVDVDINPYLVTLTCLLAGTIKGGKNIFLKNNFQSLYRIKIKGKKEKIDHSAGTTINQYYGDWGQSKCGIHAKDVSDSLTQALFLCNLDEYFPSTIYEVENKKFIDLRNPGPIMSGDNVTENTYKLLHTHF